MDDETLAVMIASGAYVGRDVVKKMLGPTAEYIGQGARDFLKHRVESLRRIFANAERKSGARLDEPGTVPPKVLKVILDEGSFATDSLAIEYFGGVLASSRSELGRDDRGAYHAKVVGSLSTYQLRAHYLVYRTLRRLYSGKGLRVDNMGRWVMRPFIPEAEFIAAMDFNDQERAQYAQLVDHVLVGLERESLIAGDWHYGDHTYVTSWLPGAPSAGILLRPGVFGPELFLSAFGHSDKPLEFIFDAEFAPDVPGMPDGILGAFDAGPPPPRA